jgi:hypothetical protein
MGEQVASRILDLEFGKCCKLCVVIKPLVGGKWDLKANVELLKRRAWCEHTVRSLPERSEYCRDMLNPRLSEGCK